MTDEIIKVTGVSIIWKFLERCSSQLVSLIVEIILARLLMPQDFGLISLVLIFISISKVFVISSLNTALIQKKEIKTEDISTVFFFSIAVGVLCYVLLYFLSPAIAAFYDIPEIITILRILGLTIFFSGGIAVLNALLSRSFKYKKIFLGSLTAALVSGFIGIYIAFTGGGVWALVWQTMSFSVVQCIVLWIMTRWRPKFYFSISKLKPLFSYSWKLIVSGFVDKIYLNLSSLIVGKLYTSDTLGYFTEGRNLSSSAIDSLNVAIKSVLLPAFSKKQNDKGMIKEIMHWTLITSSFITFPLIACLIGSAVPLVETVLTDKWLPAIPFFICFSCLNALLPISSVNLQAINGIGRTDVYLKLDIIKKSCGFLIILISVSFGIYAIAIGLVISGFLETVINAYKSKQLFDYGFFEQWKDMIPNLFLAGIVFCAVFSINFISLPSWTLLIIQLTVGFGVHFGLGYLLKFKGFENLKTTVKSWIRSGKSKNNNKV